MGLFSSLFGKPKFESINQQQAVDLVDEFKRTQILDVRTPEEYRQGAVRGSMNISVTDPAFKQKVETLDKDGVYLVYCKGGKRSKKACEEMTDLGFDVAVDDSAFMTDVNNSSFDVKGA